jgi:predicted PurR-regulated permease PerM
VKLSPLAIAVSVAAGAEVGGIVGALLGIPLAGALKVVSRELVAWRRQPSFDAGDPGTRRCEEPAANGSSKSSEREKGMPT